MCEETDPTKNDLEEQAQDYEVVVNDDDDTSPKRTKSWLLAASCLAVVAAVAIAVAVTQTKDDSSSSSSTASRGGIDTDSSGTEGNEATTTTTTMTTLSPTLSPTLAPTMFTPLPTLSPTTAEPTISLAPSTSTPPTEKPTSEPSQSFAPSSNDLEKLKLALGLEDSFSAAALEWMVEHGDVDLEDPMRLGQRYALLALDTKLHQTNEPTIVLGDGFQTLDDDECQWKGVVCTNDTVTELAWIDDGLVGPIPTEISRLRNLTKLDWAENQLQGELPWQLFELTNLQYLFLHRNQLEGTLSEEFSQLFNLEYLYLGDNRFTGRFPRGLGSPSVGKQYVRPLRYLSLYNNSLEGPFPDILNLRNLYYLDVGHNNMNGTLPTDWWLNRNRFASLTHLYLNDNDFTGEFTDDFVSIGQGRLNQLVVHNNRFSGTIPGSWNPTNFLQVVSTYNNQFEAMDKNLCIMSVFVGGELTSLRADCDACSCGSPFCSAPLCQE